MTTAWSVEALWSDAVFSPVPARNAFEVTVERLASAIRLGVLNAGDGISPVTVNVYGPTAVTVAEVQFSGLGQAGKAFTSTLQMLAVWVQRDGRWQVAVLQSKGLPAKRTAKN